LKVSSATSARAKAAPRATGRSSDRRPPTHISVDEFALTGPSADLDPNHNAYRKDLADVALAGRVIASHYAEPVEREIATATALRAGPSADAETIRELQPGERFDMLDDSLGWAWGYAGADRQVGYVHLSAIAGC
jgi:hypothetical protein